MNRTIFSPKITAKKHVAKIFLKTVQYRYLILYKQILFLKNLLNNKKKNTRMKNLIKFIN